MSEKVFIRWQSALVRPARDYASSMECQCNVYNNLNRETEMKGMSQ